jgi:hypothetical protein
MTMVLLSILLFMGTALAYSATERVMVATRAERHRHERSPP